MKTQVKTTWSFINHRNCEVTYSMSFNCENCMWTEITNPCRFRSHNCWNATSLKVWTGIKWKLHLNSMKY